MEIVKVVQALFISLDQHMVHEEKDTPCTARTSNLNEDLGMVSLTHRIMHPDADLLVSYEGNVWFWRHSIAPASVGC